LLALAVGGILWGREAAGFLAEHLADLTAWIEGRGTWGLIVFTAGYIVATLIFIPGSLLTAAAGFIFGLWQGTLLVAVAATLSACTAFLLGRSLARGFVETHIAKSPRFAALDQAVSREGLKIVMLLRLSPVFPFSVLNYGLGLTGVRFRHYFLACVAMLPTTFLYVYYGYTAKNVAELVGGGGSLDPAQWALLLVGLVATLAVTVVVARIARRALNECHHEGFLRPFPRF